MRGNQPGALRQRASGRIDVRPIRWPARRALSISSPSANLVGPTKGQHRATKIKRARSQVLRALFSLAKGKLMAVEIDSQPGRTTKVVVATSVMLSFISFWRAAAIVLNDLGSSAYYVGGIAEKAVGHAAPWFILGVMLFSYAVRAVYVESCAMFTRGGVYRNVKEALGGTFAKISVSALMFDYILTGPISGVSAGQYIAGLINELLAALS